MIFGHGSQLRTSSLQFVVGVGIDTVEVDRFREIVERRPALVARLFTEQEQAYGRRFADPAAQLAARFAAKEAAMKALGVGLGAFGFHDVEILRGDDGAPSLHVTGEAARLADVQGVRSWKVSLTHTCRVASAVVIAE